MDKEEIERLADNVFNAQQRYTHLGMVNTYPMTSKEKQKLNREYSLAETAMIEARQELRAAQGL